MRYYLSQNELKNSISFHPDQLLLPLNLLVGGCVFYDPGRNSRVNWSIDVQKETKHYLTNLDVIGAFDVCDQLDSWEFKG